jgi:nucleoside-diphosphate-sugar epimerase
MKAIVTGGAGFIGSHIAERLLNDGHEVVIIDDLSAGKEANIPEGAVFIKADVLHDAVYKDQLRDADVVFHNAASKKNVCVVDPERDLDVNSKGTLRLLLACRECGVKAFIHASTGSVYGETDSLLKEDGPINPVSYYGVSKLAGERYAALVGDDNMSVVMLRYFHVYGSRQEDDPTLGGVVAVFRRQIREGGPITIHGDGSQKRVFTHVSDVVEANMSAWHRHKEVRGRVFNCASNIPISVIGLAGTLIRKSGKKIELAYLPELEGDIYRFDVDNTRIKEELGINFTAFNP